MCVILHKPVGKTVGLETLKRCWDRNSHGAGFMFVQEGSVWGNKGYMTFGALLKGLTDSGFFKKGKLTGKHAVTIHFRLASHGSIKPSNCHPFPVTDDLKVVKARFWEADCGVAHNGVIQIERPAKDISDTMAYVVGRLCEIYSRLDSDRELYEQMARETYGSRLFILYPDGHYVLSGTWVEHEGVLYSNESFKAWPVVRRLPVASGNMGSHQAYMSIKAQMEELQSKAGLPRREHAPPGMKWPKGV